MLGKEKQNINMEQFRMTRTNRLQRLYDNTWLWQDINIGFVFYFSMIIIELTILII